MISFPGNYDSDGQILFQNWADTINDELSDAQIVLEATLVALSSVITIFSILRIMRTSKKLSATNSQVVANETTMIIHSILLAIISVVTAFDTYYRFGEIHSASIINISTFYLEMLVQLLLCYICWT
jgi:hypothetical protein